MFVDIWFVIVPDQTISGIEFRDSDMDRFRSDVSNAYGTAFERLRLLSLRATSVSGTKSIELLLIGACEWDVHRYDFAARLYCFVNITY